MDGQKFIGLIGKKLSGTISNEENVSLKMYLSESVEAQKEFEYLSQIWKITGKLKLDHDVNVEQAWKEFVVLKNQPQQKQIHWMPWISGVAAALVLAFGLAFFLSLPTDKVYVSGDFGTEEVLLSDGSIVYLAPSSELRVSQSFGEEDRQMTLEGEAFFEVAKDEQKPFIVESGGSTTQVLGTTFNINARPERSEILINVFSGKVSFSKGDNALILIKEMSASLDKTSGDLQKMDWNENEVAWITRKLVFKDASLSQVIEDLQDFFNIRIKLDSEDLKGCLFTGTFEEPDLNEVIKVLAISLNLKIEKLNNTYIIEGQGCNN